MNGNLDIFIIHCLFYFPVILSFTISIYFLLQSEDHKIYVPWVIFIFLVLIAIYFNFKFPKFNEKLIKNKNYQNTNKSLENQLSIYKIKNDSLKKENDNLKKKLDVTIAANQNILNSRIRTPSNFNTSIQDLSKQRNTYLFELIGGYKSKVDSLQEKLAQKEQDVGKLYKKEYNQLKTERDNCRTELYKLQLLYSTLNDNHNKMRQAFIDSLQAHDKK